MRDLIYVALLWVVGVLLSLGITVGIVYLIVKFVMYLINSGG